MRRVLEVASAIALVLTMAIALPVRALAHDDEPRLSVEPAKTWPGGTTTVRGDLPTTTLVSLELVGPEGRRIALATVEDPGNGHLQRAVVIPKTVSSGSWILEATAGGVPLAKAAVTVAARPAEGEQDERAEPVSAPDALRPTALPSRVRTSVPPATPGRPMVSWVLWAVAAAAAAGLLVWIRRRGVLHRAT